MNASPRIVSLLPSATEIAVALGLDGQIVGRSHECDFPSWVEHLPVCTATKLEKGLTSLEIDNRVREIVSQGLSVYEVDSELLRDLRPDVILTQSQCAVCAVTPADLEETLACWLAGTPTLVSLAPETLSDVWDDLRRVAAAVGIPDQAEPVVEKLQARLDALRARDGRHARRPTVAAIEWTEPLMAAGNWVPELVTIAGGEPLFMTPGQHSAWLDWSTLVEQDPDFVIFMPCGYQIPQTLAALAPLVERAEWHGLSAVRASHVFVADGHHFFNRPGPRIVDSAEIIAAILEAPDGKDGSLGEGWVRVRGAE